MARLEVEETGPYAGAVRVFVDSEQVGSINRASTTEYRTVVEKLAADGISATCRAVIYGGHQAVDQDSQGFYGVGLLQPGHPAPAPPDAPFLPPAVGVRVVVSDDVAQRLDGELNSRAKSFVRRTTGLLEQQSDGWLLHLDGEPLGPLDSEYLTDERALLAATRGRHPLTCAVRVIREPKRPLRVVADVPVRWRDLG